MAYQLLVCDLMTDTRLEVLPISGVSWDDYIGKTGSLSGTLPVSSSAMAQRIRETALPGRTMLHLMEDGQLAWSGVLWTRTRQRDARGFYSCAIQAGGLEGYFRSHRLLFADLVAVGADQFDIARQLITYAQAQAGGNLGVELDASLSGVLRDRSYSRYDLPWIGNALDQLASTQGGFEWRIQVWADSAGVRRRSLRLGYPTLTVGGADMVLDSPGPVTTYSLPEDATAMANSWQSRGASTGTDMGAEQVPLMSALLTTPSDWSAGWPRLDGTSDYSTVETQDVLDQHAAADLARAVRPVAVPSVSYTGGDRPQLGSYVRLRITDTWHYDGLDARYRVVGLKVTPAERGRSQTTDLFLEVA
jgi:hypothetical protein